MGNEQIAFYRETENGKVLRDRILTACAGYDSAWAVSFRIFGPFYAKIEMMF
jgi:hypothetical protein